MLTGILDHRQSLGGNLVDLPCPSTISPTTQQHINKCKPAVHPYLETALQRVAQVFCDLVYADAAHGTDSQRPDQGIGVLRVLHSQRFSSSALTHAEFASCMSNV